MKSKVFYFVLVGVLLILFFVIFYVLNIVGKKYTRGLSQLSAPPQDSLSVRKVRTVKKIILQEEEGSGSCLEITPDGIIRTYAVCGGELVDANRLANPKNILRLIQTASQIDLSLYKKKPIGPAYILTIESDLGTETIFIPKGEAGGEIDEIITQIKGDLPQPTVTPADYISTPTPSLGGVSSTSTPIPLVSATLGSLPTPVPSDNPEQPFSCGFSEAGIGKPYNVSNFICSTGPTPAP